MATNDKCCTVVPYYEIREGNHAAFKEVCERLVRKTESEAGCLYYGFSFNGDQAFCREGHADGQAILDHLENVGLLFEEALRFAELSRFEVHGPEEELAKLRGGGRPDHRT